MFLLSEQNGEKQLDSQNRNKYDLIQKDENDKNSLFL